MEGRRTARWVLPKRRREVSVVAISLPLRYTSRSLTWAHNGLKAMVGLVTAGLGCLLIYELGISQGLLLGA